MKLGKLFAVAGLVLSPLVLTTVSLRISDLTLVLGVILFSNPATQLIGGLIVGTLLVNLITGIIPELLVIGQGAYFL
jgi:hypothetical protein